MQRASSSERRVATVVAFALVFSGAVTSFGADPPPLWGSLQPGPYAVGFRVIEKIDPTRPLDSGAPRPLQIGVWYPAHGPRSAGFPYRRYLELVASEVRFDGVTVEDRRKAIDAYLDRLANAGVGREACRTWLATPTGAVWDAPPEDGPFPRVLLAQGNSHSLHHLSVLAEVLASHGYLVASTPSQGRITRPPRTIDDVLPSAGEQADDLDFLDTFTRSLPQCDGDPPALLGYSFGGRSALLEAMRSKSSWALVSLDGGMANALGKGQLEKAPSFDAAAFRTPLLHLYQSGDQAVQPNFDLIEALTRSDRLLVHLADLRHVHFSSMGAVASRVPGFAALLPDSTSIAPVWEVMATSVVQFLDATHDAAARRGVLDLDTLENTLRGAHAAGAVVAWRRLGASGAAPGGSPAGH